MAMISNAGRSESSPPPSYDHLRRGRPLDRPIYHLSRSPIRSKSRGRNEKVSYNPHPLPRHKGGKVTTRGLGVDGIEDDDIRDRDLWGCREMYPTYQGGMRGRYLNRFSARGFEDDDIRDGDDYSDDPKERDSDNGD